MRKNVQKLLAAIMALAMMLSIGACAEELDIKIPDLGSTPDTTPTTPQAQTVTVAQPLDLDEMFAAPDNAVQDFHYWTDEEFPYESNPSRDKNPQVHYYVLDTQAMAEYAQMLQENGFTLVDYHNQSDKFVEWSLTSDRCPDAETITSVYEKTQCHVNIWRSDDKRKFRVDVSKDLQVCDIGLRRDGVTADVKPQGQSAGAGLLRLPDGSYQTSDGRLTAPVGTAMVLRDGTAYNTTATFDLNKGVEGIKTGNYYRDQFIYLQHGGNSLMTGDIFREQDLAGESVFEELDNSKVTGRSFGSKPGVVLSHGEKALLPCFVQDNFEELTMRVMYYQQGGDAVYYVYGRFADSKEPKEVEALIAVNMAGDGVVEDATYMKAGSTVKLQYTHREFGTKFDVFKWEVIDGKDKVSISSTGDTCEVTGTAAGVAIVRVTYEYGVEEPDVLTGNPRTVTKAITQDYNFIIE